jgi:hypothetical protein
MKKRAFGAILLLVGTASAARAGLLDVNWRNEFNMYADDEESFTPYELDGTLLNSQWKSWVELWTSSNTFVQVGFFAEHEAGSNNFADVFPQVQSNTLPAGYWTAGILPVISWRYKDDHTRFNLGSIDTYNNHELLEPIQVQQVQIIRPIEYGAQIYEDYSWFRGEAYITWLRLAFPAPPDTLVAEAQEPYYNTPPLSENQREQFVTAARVEADAASWLTFKGQIKNFHQGGTGVDSEVAGDVANNRLIAAGGSFHGTCGMLGPSELAAWGLNSHDSFFVSNIIGYGLYVQESIRPSIPFIGPVTIYGSEFRGRNWISAEGDPNYNSIGANNPLGLYSSKEDLPGFYKTNRYVEDVGFRKVIPFVLGTTLSIQELNQFVDNRFVYQFDFTGRLAFDLHIWSPAPRGG